MKREMPFLSPISILITVLVFTILGISLWQYGGLGFSPGPVSAHSRAGVVLQGFNSHADFEHDCQYCHRPLAANQTDLCISCHENIAEQRVSKTGTHGRIDPALRCATCHPEHKGRNNDPVEYAVSKFDHSVTQLLLTGAHAALNCDQCHQQANYKLVYQGCSGCHSEPRSHAGLFPLKCEECHTDLTWKPAVIAGQPFDHNQAAFKLTRHTRLNSGQEILCSDCHASIGNHFDLQTCVSCHSTLDIKFMQNHQQTMGSDCLQCHDGTDRMSGFDHNTVFPLVDQHSQLDCAACHKNYQFKGTSSDCVACHQAPKIHEGFFGTQCQYCHSVQAWRPAKLIQHTFLLDHGEQGEIACQVCHPDSYAKTTCYNCHAHSPTETAKKHRELNISADDLLSCARCHPTGREDEAKRP